MSNKLLSRLLSFTMSATVALTSGVPALAYDGGGGELPEDEEIQLLEEEEVESDFDALEDDINVFEEDDETGNFLANPDAGDEVIFYFYNGSMSQVLGSKTVVNDEGDLKVIPPELPAALVAEGYRAPVSGETYYAYAGKWYTDNTFATEVTAFNDLGNITPELSASDPNEYHVYTPAVCIDYHIALDPGEGGSLVAAQTDSTATVEDPLFTLPAASASGKTFLRWVDSDGNTASGYMTEALRGKAVNSGGTYTITLTAVYSSAATPTPEGVTRNMNIKKDNAAMADNAFVSVPYTYGDESTAYTVFTPFDGANSYTDVTWSVYTLIDDEIGFGSTYNDNVYKSNGRWNTENLKPLDLNSFATTYGLAFVESEDHKKMTIENRGPIKALPATPIVIEVVDKDNPLNIGRREIDLSISAGSLTASPSSYSFESGSVVKMGYDVLAADADIDDYENPYVRAEEITLSSSLYEKYQLNDLEFVWVGADADAFDAVTSKNGTVYVNNDETITIKPKAGLTNLGDKAGYNGDGSDPDAGGSAVAVPWDGTDAGKTFVTGVPTATNGVYEATLYARSKGSPTAFKLLTATFKVGNNLAISGAIAHGGKKANLADPAEYVDITPSNTTDLDAGGYIIKTGPSTYTTEASGTADGSTVYGVKVVDLGEVRIGETFRDVIITAKGGNGKISFIKPVGGGYPADTFTADGIEGTPTESAGEATYRLSGKCKNTAALGAKYFVLQAKDADGNLSAITAYKYTVAPADMVLTLDGEELKYGKADGTNKYEWHAAKGYTAANEAKILTIKNNSEDDVVINTTLGSVTGTGAFTLTPAAGTASVTIASGETKSITITPASSTGTISTVCDLDITSKAGTTSFAATRVNLKFVETRYDFEITKPGKPSAGNATITDGSVGEAYSYQFGVTKSNTVTGITWSIQNAEDANGVAVDLEKDYGLTLNKNTGALTGTPKKVSPVNSLAASDYALRITVRATASPNTAKGSDGTNNFDEQTVLLTIKASKKSFKHTANGAEVTADDKLDLGKVNIDKLATIDQKFTVTNSTRLDVDDVVTTITGVTKTSSGTSVGSDGFVLVYDEDSAVMNSKLASGYTLEAGDSREIGFKLDPSEWSYDEAGKYEITVTSLDTTSGAANTFVIALEVVDAPIIIYTPPTSVDFKVLQEAKSTDGATKTGVYTLSLGGTDKTADYNYEWIEGTVPGLQLATTGIVYGTPTQAGTFSVTVKATKKTDSSKSGILKHDIVVLQSSTISLASTDFGFASSTAIGNNKALLLKGAVVGDAAATKGTINLTATTENAENVTITVEDAEDNRTSTQIANIMEYPENIYKGSSNYIGVDKTSFANIRTSGTENFSIVTKGSPAPGVYKVKITIKGTNTNEIVIYAMMVVVDKLTIIKPSDVTTSIGSAFAADKLNIAAAGGGYSQKIVWSEEGTKITSGATEKTEYYVTVESGSSKGTAGTTSVKTGFSLSAENNTIGTVGKTATASGLINDIKATTVKAAGTFDVNLKAMVAAKTYDDGVTYAGVIPTEPDMNADQVLKLSNADILNKTLDGVYPKQEGAKASFKIVSTKSNDINITGATGTAYGKIVGLKNGNTQVGFKGFEWDGVVSTYSNTAIPVVVTVTNSNTQIDMDAKAAVSANSNFEVVAPATATVLQNDGTATFTVRPKAGLAKGTYTDTLTISGDDFESVTFTLSFTVQDNTYLVTIDDDNSDLEKRIVYAEDNAPTGKTIEIKNFVAGSSAYNAKIYIKNTGNTQISNVNAYEVKADGSKYPDGSADTMLTLGVLPTIIAEKDSKPLTITAKKLVSGVYSTYVNIHFTEGTGASATEHDVKIPVTYTVYDKDLTTITVLPTDDIEISAAEGYAPADNTVKVTISNTATTPASVFTGYSVAMNSTGSAEGTYFSISTTAEKKDVAAGGSLVYTLIPKKGLEEGEYSDVITVSGGNLKTAITKNVTFKVGASTTANVKVTRVAEDYTDLGSKTATGLYNSLVYGLAERATNTNPRITVHDAANALTANTTQVIDIDFDNASTPDVSITFTGDTTADTTIARITNIDGARIVNNTITVGSKAITLTTTDVANAKGTGATARKYYSTINFTFFGKVIFGIADNNTYPTAAAHNPGASVYAETMEALANDNVIVQNVYDPSATPADYRATGTITAYVPLGSTLGSVFASGKLPTEVQPRQSMNAWYDMSSTSVVSASKVIYNYNADLSLRAAFHTHTYAPAAETNEKYVKWIWTPDASGNLSAELHLYCTDDNCPDRAASEIVVNDKAKVDGTIIEDADSDTAGDQPLKYDVPKKAPADCEHGAGYKYPASAIVYGITYTGYYIEDEVGEPLGHLYDLTVDPDITWTDKNEDGLMTVDEVKVTRTCSRDAAHVKELTVVSVGEENKVAPTCTKAGSVVYTVTYTDITATGAAASNVTKKYNNGAAVVLKAKGHNENLIAEVEEFDENTAKAYLTLTCPDCNEVLFEKKLVQFVEDASGGSYTYKALLSNGEEYIVTYTNHAHVWEGEWSWTSDLSKATLTMTCKQGTRPEIKEFTVDSVVTKKGAMYTYTVEYTYNWTEKGEPKSKTFTDSKQIVKSDDGQVVEDIVPIAEDLGIYIEGLETEYFYTGAAIKPSFSVIDASTGLVYLVPGVDYTVSYKNNKKLGDTATITVKGKGNYDGQSAVATFKILDPKTDVAEEDVMDLKGYKVSVPKDVVLTYNGEAQMPSKIVVKKGKVATTYTLDSTGYVDADGKALDAVVTVSNNVNAGTAKLLLTGKNNAKGTATTAGTSFKIAPAPLAGDGAALSIDPTKLQWAVNGARPAVTVTWNGQELLAGRDFTVAYKNNKKIGASASVIVKGKGNFDKKTVLSKSFEVEAFDLADAEIIAATGVAAGKAAKSVKVTVIDANGDIIPAGKLAVVVKADDVAVTGKLVEKTEYTIVATPKNAKVAEVKGETPAFTVTAGADFGKAKVTVSKDFYKTYTGKAIELEPEDLKYITVTIGPKKTAKTLVCGEDFEIAGYTNNIKKGKMTITLKGIDEAGYTGAKTFKVTIKAKKLVK